MRITANSEPHLRLGWDSGSDTINCNGYTGVTVAQMEDMIKTLQQMIDVIKSDQFDRMYDANLTKEIE